MTKINSQNNTIDDERLEFGNPKHFSVVERLIAEQKEVEERAKNNDKDTRLIIDEITEYKAYCENCQNESDPAEWEDEAERQIVEKKEGKGYCSGCGYHFINYKP